MQTKITISGTHCASCKALIEDVCKEVPGVQSCTVDPATGATLVEHEGPLDLKRFGEEIAKVGQYKIVNPS